MKKTLILGIVILLLLLAAYFLRLGPRYWDKQATGPPILLITLDTTRADHLSCYGYEKKTSPHLDRLAEEGQRFERAVAVSSWTLPTHASLFTGLNPITHGAHYTERGEVSLIDAVEGNRDLYQQFKANALPEEALTMAERLRDEGYRTAGIGAGPWLKPVFGLSQGFDYYDCDVDSTAGRRADKVTDLAMRFLSDQGEAPFFLFLNYFDPHAPWEAPPKYANAFFPPKKLPLVKTDPKIAKEYLTSQYDAEIFFMDHEIGRLFAKLKAEGLYDRTWIIVMADHGENLGEHNLYFHGLSLFESEVHCPLIIKWPKGWENQPSVQERCGQVDIMPTVMARLSIELPGPFEGQPLGTGSRPFICELNRNPGSVSLLGNRFDRKLQAIYHENYKLILSSKDDDLDSGLFDLAKDPLEGENLAGDKPDVTAQLMKTLLQWKETRPKPLKPKPVNSLDEKTEEQLRALGYGH